MTGAAVGLVASGIASLAFGIVYRLARIRVQREPKTPEELDNLRAQLALRPRSGRSQAREYLHIVEDWHYPLKRERLYLSLGAVLIVAAVVVVLL